MFYSFLIVAFAALFMLLSSEDASGWVMLTFPDVSGIPCQRGCTHRRVACYANTEGGGDLHHEDVLI